MGRTVAFLKSDPSLFPLRKEPTTKPSNVSIELQMQAAKLPAWETEHEFAKAALGRKWAMDYAWPAHRIALEVEGMSFGRVVKLGSGGATMTVKGRSVYLKPFSTVRTGGGRHTTGQGFRADCEKYSQAAILGWTVVRVTYDMIKDGAAIKLLEAAFASRAKA